MTFDVDLALSPFMLAADAAADHITTGEIMVSVTTFVLVVATSVLAYVSIRLVRVTTMAANAEMARVSMRSSDNMADVAESVIDHRDDDDTTRPAVDHLDDDEPQS